VPAVRRTHPGLLDVAPEATEFIALLIAVCAPVPDVDFTVIVLCAPNTVGKVVKIRHVTRNRVPSCLFSIVSPLGWVFIGK
jgi:hypothetical protein